MRSGASVSPSSRSVWAPAEIGTAIACGVSWSPNRRVVSRVPSALA